MDDEMYGYYEDAEDSDNEDEDNDKDEELKI